MMAQIQLRKAENKDLSSILELFIASITESCAKDYSPEAIAAWKKSADDIEKWTGHLQEQYFLTAWSGNELAGFSSLKGSDYLDFMYVHPRFQGQGVAKKLLAQIEAEARKSKAEKLKADVSLTARPFFTSKGFEVVRENQHERSGVLLTNFRMEKELNTANAIVFFDGYCVLCNGFADFLIKIDKKNKLKFATLQGQIARAYSVQQKEDGGDTVHFYHNQKIHDRFDAVISIFKYLGGIWKTVLIFKILPRSWRNGIYNFISRNRKTFFGTRKSCRIPTPEEKDKLLP